jgi:hypothetical protein
MSLKSKARAARKREHAKQQRAADEQRVQDNAVRLKTMTAGFGRTERTDKQVQAFKQSKMPTYNVDTRKHIHHGEDRFSGKLAKPKEVLSEEMQERDRLAHERTHEIQKRVDQVYNKGGLQLMSESEFQAMQRGELRRRS